MYLSNLGGLPIRFIIYLALEGFHLQMSRSTSLRLSDALDERGISAPTPVELNGEADTFLQDMYILGLLEGPTYNHHDDEYLGGPDFD